MSLEDRISKINTQVKQIQNELDGVAKELPTSVEIFNSFIKKVTSDLKFVKRSVKSNKSAIMKTYNKLKTKDSKQEFNIQLMDSTHGRFLSGKIKQILQELGNNKIIRKTLDNYNIQNEDKINYLIADVRKLNNTAHTTDQFIKKFNKLLKHLKSKFQIQEVVNNRIDTDTDQLVKEFIKMDNQTKNNTDALKKHEENLVKIKTKLENNLELKINRLTTKTDVMKDEYHNRIRTTVNMIKRLTSKTNVMKDEYHKRIRTTVNMISKIIGESKKTSNSVKNLEKKIYILRSINKKYIKQFEPYFSKKVIKKMPKYVKVILKNFNKFLKRWYTELRDIDLFKKSKKYRGKRRRKTRKIN